VFATWPEPTELYTHIEIIYTHVERLTYTMASAGCVTLLLVAGLLHEEVVVQDRSSRVFAFLLRVPGKRIGR
jgi:hypothetical protein